MGRSNLILVDTHIVVWLAFEQSRISQLARSAINDARQTGGGLAISDITFLELTTLAQKGRLHSHVGLEPFLQDVENRFTPLRITARACVRALGLPSSFPRDPADRVIAGTALAEGLPLVTADQHIRRSRALQTIW